MLYFRRCSVSHSGLVLRNLNFSINPFQNLLFFSSRLGLRLRLRTPKPQCFNKFLTICCFFVVAWPPRPTANSETSIDQQIPLRMFVFSSRLALRLRPRTLKPPFFNEYLFNMFVSLSRLVLRLRPRTPKPSFLNKILSTLACVAPSGAVCWTAGAVTQSSAVCWIAACIPKRSFYPAQCAG